MSEEIESSVKLARHQTELRLRYDFQKLNLKLQKVTEEIDSIRGEVMEIKNISATMEEDVQLSHDSSSSRLNAPPSKDAAVGFDDDLMAIKTRLCGESSKLQFIPILGMGGIGKTTLAKNAYDDQLTVEHFQIRAWVTVSQNYCAQEIISGLLISMKAERSGKSNGSTEESVYKSLKGKRYLIVMDDMWSTKAWDDVKMIFPDDHNGSRIMLTTRLLDVAAYPDSCSPRHEMRFMDVDQSWNLLRQKVFIRGENCPPELETTGKTIARRCRGLPLAIVVIAGVLSTVGKTQASWENIARNVNVAVTANDEHFAKIVLSLSYNHMPHHLRPCFLYIGGFPEDYEISVSELIKLWVAEGFLKPPSIGSYSKSFEEVAEEYLEDLVKRSLVLVVKRKSNGKIKSCSVHDLVRDLCIRKAEHEKFFLNLTDRYGSKDFTVLPKSMKNPRRVSMINPLLKVDGGLTLRSIMFIHCRGITFHDFRLLRVLAVENSIPRFLPLHDEVFKLFHLRYLAFARYVDIPAAVSNLQNLQTLIIRSTHKRWSGETYKVNLPVEIWRMPQLRHLVTLAQLPEEGETLALQNLQTLSMVKNFKCTQRILKMIPNIKKLEISYFRCENIEDYHLDNLVHLHQLEKLKLKVRMGFPSFVGEFNPVFPTTLKKLTLSGWKLPWKFMGIVGSLPNLEVLKLRNYACTDPKWETSEGDFPRLKFLLIEDSGLEKWITESSHFPSLQCLVLHRCARLSEIPDGIGEIPTLELIEVDERNTFLVYSAKRIQEEQKRWGNDALNVRVV